MTFFYNVIEMTTTTKEKRVWESHRDFYDVHLILEGSERIAFNFISNMSLGNYNKEDDWQQMEGEALFEIPFKKNQILLLDPNDAHKTGLSVVTPEFLRKVVFKVKI